MNRWHDSLRFRLLLPLVASATITALVVAYLSFYLGRLWSMQDVEARFLRLSETLAPSAFPLTSNVVNSLGHLTNTELVTASADTIRESSFPKPDLLDLKAIRKSLDESPATIVVASNDYLVFRCELESNRASDRANSVYVLFDRQDVDASSIRAAMLPLLTGLATISVLGITMYFLIDRISRRLAELQQRVSVVAAGDFSVQCDDQIHDEVGRLGGAVNSMAAQLDQLWLEVSKQQRSKLLFQLAGGMAHQLRNTLTGSKMAMELHARNVNVDTHEEVKVAIRQLEIAEEYVQSLLLIGQGKLLQESHPDRIGACVEELKASLSTVAQHLKKELKWEIDEMLYNECISDRPSFTIAISNLVLNAIQQGQHITVNIFRSSNVNDGYSVPADRITVKVADDGPGVDTRVQHELFEPFVSTKPEGIGLGLPTVRRAAERLNGDISWQRERETTVFEFACPLEPCVAKQDGVGR